MPAKSAAGATCSIGGTEPSSRVVDFVGTVGTAWADMVISGLPSRRVSQSWRAFRTLLGNKLPNVRDNH
jgi:hypothetical protein